MTIRRRVLRSHHVESLLIPLFLCLSVTGASSPFEFRTSSPGPGAGTAVTVCAIDPQDPDIVYVGGDCQGIMRTLDGGTSWSAPNRGLILPQDPFYEAYFTLEIEIDPSHPQHIYAGTQRGLFHSSDRAENWQPIDLGDAIALVGDGNHIPIGTIEVDPADSKIIFVGLGDVYQQDHASPRGLLLRSNDQGETWERLGANVIPTDSIIYDIELAPSANTPQDRLVLVSTDQGIFRSLDGGDTFFRFQDGLPHTKARRLTVSRTRGGPTYFYVTLSPNQDAPGGVFRWRTDQSAWTSANGENGEAPLILEDGSPCIFNWIVAHPSNPKLVYLASAPSYIATEQCDTETYFITEDGGLTWEEQWPTPESAWVIEPSILSMLAISESDPSTLVGGYVSMIKSTDGGDEWKQIYADTDHTVTPNRSRSRGLDIGSQLWSLSIAADPRPEFSDTIYLGHADALLFKTEDLQWFQRLSAFPAQDPIAELAEGWGEEGDGNLTPQISLDPANPDIVYASANFRLFRSQDRGQTWTDLTGWSNPYTDLSDEILNRDNAARFAIDPSSPQEQRRIFATVFPGALYRSTNNGETWEDLSNRLPGESRHISGVYLDPSNSNRIFLGTFSQIHYSQQNMWERYPVYFSNDGGNTWTARGELPLVNRIWIDPLDGNRLLAATLDMNEEENQGGIHLSTDGGTTWTRTLAQPTVTDLAADPHHSDRMWSLSSAYYQPDTGFDLPGVQAGLYVSHDRGNHWERTNLELNHYMLYPLLVHPGRPNELFIGTAGTGVKRVLYSEPSTAPPNLSIHLTAQGYRIEATHLHPNQTYELQHSSRLPNWEQLETVTADATNSAAWDYPAATATSRFFRLIIRE